MPCKINFIVCKFFISVLLTLTSINSYGQDSSAGAAALGRALGTLLGNIFRDDSPPTPSPQGFSNPNIAPILQVQNNDLPTETSMDAFKSQSKLMQEKIKEACLDEKYKLYFSKSPCNASEMNMMYLTDTSKPNAREKEVIRIVDVPFIEITKLHIENYKSNIKPASLGESYGSLFAKYSNLSQDNLLSLYKGKLSWGEYNNIRKDIAQKFKSEFDILNK